MKKLVHEFVPASDNLWEEHVFLAGIENFVELAAVETPVQPMFSSMGHFERIIYTIRPLHTAKY